MKICVAIVHKDFFFLNIRGRRIFSPPFSFDGYAQSPLDEINPDAVINDFARNFTKALTLSRELRTIERAKTEIPLSSFNERTENLSFSGMKEPVSHLPFSLSDLKNDSKRAKMQLLRCFKKELSYEQKTLFSGRVAVSAGYGIGN